MNTVPKTVRLPKTVLVAMWPNAHGSRRIFSSSVNTTGDACSGAAIAATLPD